jgi:hypothetical protein
MNSQEWCSKALPAGRRLAWLGCAKRERVRGAITTQRCEVEGPSCTGEKNFLRLVAFIRESPTRDLRLLLYVVTRRVGSVSERQKGYHKTSARKLNFGKTHAHSLFLFSASLFYSQPISPSLMPKFVVSVSAEEYDAQAQAPDLRQLLICVSPDG